MSTVTPGEAPPPYEETAPIAGEKQAQYGAGPAHQTVIVHNVVCYDDVPVHVTCPACHSHVLTVTHYDSGACAWLACFGLFLIGLWPCCWIPFCMDCSRDVIHVCPKCDALLGKKSRI
jgi:lipopolysaccharide-induced tumor necrosis factor-alpha factor